MFGTSKYIKIEGDKTIWGIVFSLLIFSILIVYSIEGISSTLTHLRNIIIGILVMYFTHKLKFKYFSKLSLVGIIVSIFLLIFVFIIGQEINGAKRWIYLGSLSFQPSDFAKIILLIFLSRQISKYRDYLYDFKGVLWHILLPTFFICILILPSNLSTSILVFINVFLLMIFGKIHVKFLIIIISISLGSSFFMYTAAKYIPAFSETIPRSKTWVNRIDGFLYSSNESVNDKGHQLNEAKIAIKNGGFLGKGPGQSIQRHFLYASSSDFIFAIIVEQYGAILGGVFPMFLYLLFFYRCVLISQRTSSVFGSLMVASISFSILMQALVNMMVNVGLMPVTGQTLPLISKGGTSIIFTCFAIGVILSVSKNPKLENNYETS